MGFGRRLKLLRAIVCRGHVVSDRGFQRTVTVVLALLAGMFVSSAAIVTAASGNPAVSSGSVVDNESQLLSQAQSKLDAWRAWLGSAQAIAARVKSKTAYEQESNAQAETTARGAFPDQVGAPGLRTLTKSGETILRKVGANGAIVGESAGKRGFVESTFPVDGQTPDGRAAPLDLSLVNQNGAFVPSSALVPVSIPGGSGGSVSFGDANFGVKFGAWPGSAGQQAGGSVFYPNIAGQASDTDAVVRAVAGGAEISYVLRSEASPESQTLSFDFPAGWRLNDPGDGSGMVQVLDNSGKAVATASSGGVRCAGPDRPNELSDR